MSTYMLLMGLMLCAATFFSSTADAKNKPGDSILRHKPIKAVNFPGVKVKEDSLKNNKGSVHVRLGKQDKVDEELVNEHLPEEVVSSYYEGDIILTPLQKEWLETNKREEVNKLTSDEGQIERRAVVLASREKWANGIVPYVFDSRLSRDARDAIEDAISEYAKTTCIQFRPRNRESDYIRFFAGNGCYSYIGRVGGVQEISIGSGCEYTGIVMHEIFHALGRWHEQSRPDRDLYIRVNYDNIRYGLEQNFAKVSTYSATTNGVRYDIQSIMHYGAYAFSRNGQPTIVPRSASGTTRVDDVGQRDRFTSLDLEHVNRLYNCDSTSSNSGSWSSWSSWGTCSASCDGGIQSRSRSCIGGVCDGARTQTQSCNSKGCSGYWRSWSAWGYCSCFTKTQTRSRRCSVSGGCIGSSSQTRSCTNNNCGSTISTWGSWGAWKCGRSFRWRRRECVGSSCSGSRIEFKRCRYTCVCSQSGEPAAQAPASSNPAVPSVSVCMLLKIQGDQNLHTLGDDVIIGIFDEEDAFQSCITLAAKKGLHSVGIVGGYCISGSVIEAKDLLIQPSNECVNGTGKYISYTSSEQYMNVYKVDSSLQAAVHEDDLKEEGKALESINGAKTPLNSIFVISILTVLTLVLF